MQTAASEFNNMGGFPMGGFGFGGFGGLSKQICESTTTILMSQKDDKISCLEHKLLASEFDRKFDHVNSNFNNLAIQVGTIGSAINQFASNIKV